MKREKVPTIKLGWQRGPPTYQNFHKHWKRSIQNGKRPICYIKQEVKPHNNSIALSLQYCKLKRKSHKAAKGLIGRLHTAEIDCGYHEYDWRLIDQFIHGSVDRHDRYNIEGNNNGQIYQWGHEWPNMNMGTKGGGTVSTKEVLGHIREGKGFDSIRQGQVQI